MKKKKKKKSVGSATFGSTGWGYGYWVLGYHLVCRMLCSAHCGWSRTRRSATNLALIDGASGHRDTLAHRFLIDRAKLRREDAEWEI